MGDAIMAPAIEVARQRSFGQSFSDVQIVESELGDRAGALGVRGLTVTPQLPVDILGVYVFRPAGASL